MANACVVFYFPQTRHPNLRLVTGVNQLRNSYAIYIQAKKWAETNGVGRPEIQKFAGALQGHRARKGVFITTSYFTKEAEDYVTRIDSKIVLIDGETLARKQGLRGQLWDDRDLHLTQPDPPDERGRSNRKSCAKLLDLQHLGLG